MIARVSTKATAVAVAGLALLTVAPVGAAPRASVAVDGMPAEECAVVGQRIAMWQSILARQGVITVRETTMPDVGSMRERRSIWKGRRPSLAAWKDYQRKTYEERSLRGCPGLQAQLSRTGWRFVREQGGRPMLALARVGLNPDGTEAVLGDDYKVGGTEVPGHDIEEIFRATVMSRSPGSDSWVEAGEYQYTRYR